MSGKLIRLFLVDGNPNGLRTVEISNMTIYATIFPRTKLKEFLSRSESKKPGSYILLGDIIDDRVDEVAENKAISKVAYIGEGAPVQDRLKAHAIGTNQKDFWDEAIVFTSKDDYITKTQIQYLESEMYRLAWEADKVKLENTQTPSKPDLSEVDNSEIKNFLEGAKLILSSIGIDIFESPKDVKNKIGEIKEKIFCFDTKGVHGKMKIEEDKYIVLKGSTAVIENRPSAKSNIINMRADLEEKGIIVKDSENHIFIFQEDYIFNSPSYAAVAISGGHENGRQVWRYGGKNLNQIEAEEISEEDI